MQTQLQCVEGKCAVPSNREFSVNREPGLGQALQQCSDLRKKPCQVASRFRPQSDLGTVAKGQAAEAIPFRLEKQRVNHINGLADGVNKFTPPNMVGPTRSVFPLLPG